MSITILQTVPFNGGGYQNVFTQTWTFTAGSTVLVGLGYGTPGTDNIVLTDNKGDTWVLDQTFANTGNRESQLWRASNVTGGSTIVTFQEQASNYPDAAGVMIEVTGLTSSPLDQVGGSQTNSGTTYAASVTTVNANDFLFALATAATTAPAFTGDASWSTIVAESSGSGGGSFTAVAMQYRTVSSANTYSWTLTNSSSTSVAQAIASYKISGVAPVINGNFLSFM